MTDYCQYVNVFHGYNTCRLPEPEGVAATWHFIKAITGNTTPAAVLPFGKYSCCMYTTAYPTGYGDHYPNSNPNNLRCLEDGARFHGLSHFHQSGTGTIDYYYNYAITVPFYGSAPQVDGYDILSEEGEPGYYSVKSEGGIQSEATVSRDAVYHRFGFPTTGGRISIDFTNNGLLKLHELYTRPQCGSIHIISLHDVCAQVTLDGLKQYFRYHISGARVATLTKNGEPINGTSVDFSETEDTYGVLFEADELLIQGKLSVSLKSAEQAEAYINIDEGGFECVKKAAYEIWNSALGRIDIQNPDMEQKGIFYSNLYHSLVKPSDRSGECPLWAENGFTVDFSTLWDTYKTELPLIFTLYSEISEKIINTILCFGKYSGKFPHTLVLCDGFLVESKQACMLAEHTICDAYYRDVPADYNELLKLIEKDLSREKHKDILSKQLPRRLTHLLDESEACGAAAQLAYLLGNKKLAKQLSEYAERWHDCYDENSGLMKENFDYYEGNFWNYSFRLMRNMKERMNLAGGKEKFTELLDRFFGFTHSESLETRFEGFNNESDMESPYAYAYTRHHDRLCEIIDGANKYMFTSGSGGLPGNNDSGGLSSCYIWNTSGIFPVSGQDLMLIGTPLHEKVTFRLANEKTFTVIKSGEGIYTKSAILNGIKLPHLEFNATQMMEGGVLELVMSESPV